MELKTVKMVDPNIGRLLNNRYRLVDTIGHGSMGRVYKAEDTLLGGMPVAIKLLAHSLLNQKMRDRFEREATISALLGHNNVHIVLVRDYGVDQENGTPFYVMEHLQGSSLSEVIQHQPMLLERFIKITRQVCLGLHSAHRGISISGKLTPIVHRDIKPSNIFIIQDPNLGELSKILDFGIAKALQEDAAQTSSFMGTLAYCSPEQMEGQDLDARSDIYSLGVTMYQMLSGKMPIYADTQTFGSWYRAHREQQPRPFEIVNATLKVPKELERLIMRCLAKLPGDRPQSVMDIVQELEPLGDRYARGYNIGKRIEGLLNKSELPVATTPEPLPRRAAETLWQAAWPAGSAPQEEVSFHKIIATSEKPMATLWVMLSEQEVQNRQICTRFNQFLFAQIPHPTLLWLTVLFNRNHGARWIPRYLDLKNVDAQRMVQLMSDAGEYQILFFSIKKPDRCANVTSSSIAPAQRKLLKDWFMMGRLSPPVSQFQMTRAHLKNELERLKPQILLKLESMYTDSGDFSG